MMRIFLAGFIPVFIFFSCKPKEVERKQFQFLTLDPGHFHSALVQKSMYPEVDSTVFVYAPKGMDIDLHLARINSYNNRTETPTRWNEITDTSESYLQRMLSEKKGNIVVIAGNNKKKTDYILESVKAGLHVYADKPMVTDRDAFLKLEEAFRIAREKNLILYDIMTERFEITSILQKELAHIPEVFGVQENGSAEDPAITKESVHHFFKEVSGKPLQRPAWFYDVTQEGEGIVDVTTHLVDLVQWEAFPGQIISYPGDIEMGFCSRWPTAVSLEQFSGSTAEKEFPDYLKKYIDQSGVLQVSSNGEINYRIKGIYARVKVTWNYQAEPGGGDTHYSIMKGSLADLVIKHGKEQLFVPELYIESKGKISKAYQELLQRKLVELEKKYPGISQEKTSSGWHIIIPKNYREGHEAHFARVTENFLEFLKSGKIPAWEVPNMLAKYYVTTMALEKSSSPPLTK